MKKIVKVPLCRPFTPRWSEEPSLPNAGTAEEEIWSRTTCWHPTQVTAELLTRRDQRAKLIDSNLLVAFINTIELDGRADVADLPINPNKATGRPHIRNDHGFLTRGARRAQDIQRRRAMGSLKSQEHWKKFRFVWSTRNIERSLGSCRDGGSTEKPTVRDRGATRSPWEKPHLYIVHVVKAFWIFDPRKTETSSIVPAVTGITDCQEYW